jgi:hypothetical protein
MLNPYLYKNHYFFLYNEKAGFATTAFIVNNQKNSLTLSLTWDFQFYLITKQNKKVQFLLYIIPQKDNKTMREMRYFISKNHYRFVPKLEILINVFELNNLEYVHNELLFNYYFKIKYLEKDKLCIYDPFIRINRHYIENLMF